MIYRATRFWQDMLEYCWDIRDVCWDKSTDEGLFPNGAFEGQRRIFAIRDAALKNQIVEELFQ